MFNQVYCIWVHYNKIIMSFEENAVASLNDFQPLERIGEGSFSSVYKVRRICDGRIYAIKKVKLNVLSQRQKNNALNEVRILASIQSPFILKYRDAFLDNKQNLLCIVMEWANDGDLLKMIQTRKVEGMPISQQLVWRAASDVLLGLSLLHSKGILHRDLKAANIFICDGRYKIGDMNVSKVQSQQQLAYTQTGTPYYASPQVWKDQPYGPKADIWSYGCLIYQMCTSHPPFQGSDIESLYKQIKRGKYDRIPDTYSLELNNFIALCLSKNEHKRPTAEELLNNGPLPIKMKEYNLSMNTKSANFQLLSTIKFETDSQNTKNCFPSSRYEVETKKHLTQQTLGRSSSGAISTNKIIENQKLQLAEERKYSKIYSIKKYQANITKKLNKMLKLSQQNEEIGMENRPISKIKSMKQMQINRHSQNNQSYSINDQQDNKITCPKISKIRHLTTERKHQSPIESYRNKELDIIKQLRKKCQVHKTKMKKVNSSVEQKSIVKKYSSVFNGKDNSQGKNIVLNQPKLSIPMKNREESAFANHLRKMSQKAIKKYDSNPFLVKYDNSLSKDQHCKIEQTKCAYYLKKKGRNLKAKFC